MPKITRNLASPLVRFYVNHGMTDRLAEAILVCRYLEAVLDDIPSNQTGRIHPIFDHPISLLRDDWRSVIHFDLWFDTVNGQVVKAPPPGDGEPDLVFEHLPIDAQAKILFGRFAHLFR